MSSAINNIHKSISLNTSDLALSKSLHPSIQELQSHLLNLWTSTDVDQTYQNLFLVFIESFHHPNQQVREIEAEIKKTYEQNSLFFLLQQNLMLRTQIKAEIQDQIVQETETGTIKKAKKVDMVLKQLCDKLKNLRRINLLISENILKIFEDFKITRQSSIGSLGRNYIEIFMNIDVQNEFIKESFLNEYILFQKGYDPFFLVHYEETKKSQNFYNLKKHAPVSELFEMNISYVYRLMRAQQKMLKYMLFIDDHTGAEKERKQLINRQRLLRIANSNSNNRQQQQQADSFLPPINSRLVDRNRQQQNPSVASTIKQFMPVLQRKANILRNDEVNQPELSNARKKIYSLRPINVESIHHALDSNTPKHYSLKSKTSSNNALNPLISPKYQGRLLQPKNSKNYDTDDQINNLAFSQRQRQLAVSRDQSQNSATNSQKKWNIKRVLKDRMHNLRPVKTQQFQDDVIDEEDEQQNEFIQQSKQQYQSDSPIYISLKKSKLADSELQVISRSRYRIKQDKSRQGKKDKDRSKDRERSKERDKSKGKQQQSRKKKKSKQRSESSEEDPREKRKKQKRKKKRNSVSSEESQEVRSPKKKTKKNIKKISSSDQTQSEKSSSVSQSESRSKNQESLSLSESKSSSEESQKKKKKDSSSEESKKNKLKNKKQSVVKKMDKKRIKKSESEQESESEQRPPKKKIQNPIKQKGKQAQKQNKESSMPKKEVPQKVSAKPIPTPVPDSSDDDSQSVEDKNVKPPQKQLPVKQPQPLKKEKVQSKQPSKTSKEQGKIQTHKEEIPVKKQAQKKEPTPKRQSLQKKQEPPKKQAAPKKVEPQKKQEPKKVEPAKKQEPKKVEPPKKQEPLKKVEPIKKQELPKKVETPKTIETPKNVQPPKKVEPVKPVKPVQKKEQSEDESEDESDSQEEDSEQSEGPEIKPKPNPNQISPNSKIKMIPGKIAMSEFVDYIKSKKVHPSYSQKAQQNIKFVINSAQNTQTYLNEFHLNEQLAMIALCSPTVSGNLVIYLWMPIDKVCDEKSSIFFFKKYLDYLEQQSTCKAIVYSGGEIPELKSEGFVAQKENNYLRKRVKPVTRQSFELEYFFSMEASNICFVQTTADSLFFSDEITPLSEQNSWCNPDLLNAKDEDIDQELEEDWNVEQKIKSLSEANAILEKEDFDTFQIGAQKIVFKDINMTRSKISCVPKLGFISNDGFMIVMGKSIVFTDAKRKVDKMQMMDDVCLYIGSGFKNAQEMGQFLDKFKDKAKQQDCKFAFKMFSKQVYGRYMIKDQDLEKGKAFYCNWDLNFAWRDEIPGKIIHDMSGVKSKYGPENFVCFLEVKGVLTLGVEVEKDDFLY